MNNTDNKAETAVEGKKELFEPVVHHLHPTYQDLLTQESYTAQEISQLLLIDPDILRQAVYSGDLKGTVKNHVVTRIKHEDLLKWLQHRHEQ